MKKEEKLFLTIQYQEIDQHTLRRLIQDWLIFVRILFEPRWLALDQANQRSFSLADCVAFLKHAETLDSFSIYVGDGANEASLRLVKGHLLEKHLVTKAVFAENQKMILDYTEVQMKMKGLFASLRSYDEFLFHNVEKMAERRRFQEEAAISQLPKLRRPNGEVVVDCNQFAGYDIFYKGLTLTSCWRMYFSRFYRYVIPLAVIEEVQQVEQSHWISPQVLMIELYQDPFNWDNTSNRGYQRLFRDQLGIDQLAWNNGIGILREPFIEYAYSERMIQTVQYQNDRLQPAEKKKATHFVTRRFDLVNDQQQVKRVRGTLNAQAYFPWVDEQRMKMMNYIVIDPSYALDGGVAAYEYYLRNFLEVEVDLRDGRYQEYLVILNIYIPEEYLAEIPYRQLKEKMTDVKFSRFKKKKEQAFFDLKKDANHLRVNFLQVSALPQLEELSGG